MFWVERLVGRWSVCPSVLVIISEPFRICYTGYVFDRPAYSKQVASIALQHCPFLPRVARLQIKRKNMKNIFVGNLSFGATEETLRFMFENHGTVERVSIVTDRETGRSRGFGFVEMTNTDEAERAIAALNGADLGGRAINVDEARPKPDRG